MTIIGEQVKTYAEKNPNKLAIQVDKDKVTYKELILHIEQIQQQLLQEVKPIRGKTIAILLENDISWMEVFLAVVNLGGIAVPIKVDGEQKYVKAILEDVKPNIVVTREKRVEDFPFVQQYHILSMSSLYQLPQRFLKPEKLDGKDLFFIGYERADPEELLGITRSHQSWENSFWEEEASLFITEEDTILLPGALSSHEFLYTAVHSLHIGATILLKRNFSPGDVIQSMKAGTTMYVTPSMYEQLKAEEDFSEQCTLQKIIITCTNWSVHEREEAITLLPHTDIYACFAEKELGKVSIQEVKDPTIVQGSIGKPLASVKLSVRDQDGIEVEQGEVGQLYVSSPWLFAGYHNKKRETDEVFVGDWASVGHLAYQDANGQMILIGHKNTVIQLENRVIYPEEVEEVLLTHPSLEEVLVTQLERDEGLRVAVLYKNRTNQTITHEEIQTLCQENLEFDKCPDEYIEVSSFYYKSSGEIDIKKMKKWLSQVEVQRL
ncbi:AMP-binding protein [Pontibacillus salicampi]|uniref:AMP-binding protein n=1 Tax=Pontibacillus salicampi TaxID=1449801 RepID=A0ABV6LQ73_9BACI